MTQKIDLLIIYGKYIVTRTENNILCSIQQRFIIGITKRNFMNSIKNDKKNFCNLSSEISIDELIKLTEKVYDTELSPVSLIPNFNFGANINDFDIFKEVIIGKENINFSDMINSHKNSRLGVKRISNY